MDEQWGAVRASLLPMGIASRTRIEDVACHFQAAELLFRTEWLKRPT